MVESVILQDCNNFTMNRLDFYNDTEEMFDF
jgi:hypothetical protein